MQYWTKNGSIPSTETDGTEGWQQAPSPPTDILDGKELVWLNWEWIVRDPKPVDRAGWQWNWQHEGKTWVESPWGNVEVVEVVQPLQVESFATDQIVNPWGNVEVVEVVQPLQVESFATDQIVNLTTSQVM